VQVRPSESRRRRVRWRVAAAATAATGAVLAGCTSTAPPQASDLPAITSPLHSQLVTGASGAGAMTHIEAIQRIADDNGGNRASPGPGYDASVDYVAGVLRDAGFDVTTPTFTLSRRGQESQVRNVIAQTRTGSPDRVVLAGAHLDSVPQGPGINDNATGVATLLEIATRMGGSPPVTNAVRFAFWGAEEINLNGSKAYVESLSPQDREAIALYINLDMLASPNAGYFVQGGAGGRGSRSGPPGSAAVGRVLLEELTAKGVPAELTRFTGDSDYAPFIEANIPSGGVLTGDGEGKTPEQAQVWGGEAGQKYDICYHAACDRAETLDRKAFDDFTDAIAGTIARFATSPQVPAR
jgi:aminopeptidase S